MAEINNVSPDTLISGSNKSDTISNGGINVTISALDGNDSIDNTSQSYFNDSTDEWVTITPHNVSIDGGFGNDTVKNDGDNASIFGGADFDYIDNSGKKAIISGGEDDDTISNYGANSSISGDAGDDYLESSGYYSINGEYINPDNATISGGFGNDTVENGGANSSLDGGEGDDYIYNVGNSSTINAGAGNDSIVNHGLGADNSGNYGGDNVSIVAGAGNDTIEDIGVNSTVNPGKGNDFVRFHDEWYHENNPRRVGAAYVYASGDGDDTVSGFGNADTLVIASEYSSAISGMDVIFTVGKGHITLLGGASLSAVNVVSKLSETAPFNIVINTLSSAAFGNDSAANGKKIYGKDYTYKKVANKNYIVNEGDDVIISLNGSKSGDDYIYNEGSDVTISAGKGNDTVYNTQDNVVFNYASGDGDDVIYGFTKANRIRLGDGTTAYTQKRVLDDIVLEVGKGSITIKDGASLDSIRVTGKKSSASTDNNLIYGTSHGDVYNSTLEGATINALGGGDSICNDSANVSINGGAGNDSIYNNYASNVSINGGAGNDSVYSHHGDHVLMHGGDGNDTLNYDGGEFVTIDGGAGDDLIHANGHNASIDGGAGNDSIYNDYGENTTIRGGKGDDSIEFYWKNNLILYANGDGNDYIEGFHSESALQITSGTIDKATTDGENLFLTVGKGTISLMGAGGWGSWDNIIDANGNAISFDVDDGKAKTIYNDKNKVKLTGSDYGDTVDNFGNNVTVTSGAGDDSLRNHGVRVSINAGEGDDKIEAYMIDKDSSSYTTLRGGAGNDHIDNHGHHALIDGGTGNDTLGNYTGDDDGIHEQYEADYSTMLGGDGDDYIDNRGDNSSLDGGKGKDTIYSYGALNIKVDGGADNDYILNGWRSDWHVFGDKATINGGAGDDTLYSYGAKKVSLVGGAGNDWIYNNKVYIWNDDNTQILETVTPDNATINGGAGNDIINNSGFNATILGGAGDDTVYNSNSEVSINAGDGNDYINNHSEGDNVTIVGGKGNDYVHDEGVGTAYVYSAGNDTIGHFDAFDTLVLGSVKVKSSVKADDGTITLKLSNKKTLTLQNYRADKVNIATSIKDVKKISVIRNDETNTVVKGTSKDDYIQNDGWSYNVTIDAGKGNDYIDNRAAQASINAGAGNDSIYNVDIDSTILGGAGNDSIYNYGANISINGGAGNDSIISRGLDNTITGGAGNDHISLGAVGNLIKYASGDGKDTILGFNESDTLTVSGGKYSTQASGSDVLVKVGKGSILLKDAKGKALNINDTKTTDIITLSDGADNLRSNLEGVKIQALGGNDTVNNSASSVTIDGGEANDFISNDYADNVSISGGAGNDVLWNLARTEWNSDTGTFETVETGDNVTLNGGAGNDYIWNEAGVNVVFQYNTGDGNDTIYDFNETSTLSIAGGTYTSKKSGDNMIVTVGKGTISLLGAASLSAVTIDGVKKTSKTLTVTNSDKSPVNAASTVKIIDASTRTKNVKIAGNDAANTIFGGAKNDSIRGGKGADKIYGGSGNDTLWGDAGNDSLYGGDGNDTFIYKPGEGTDKIFDYASGDMLKILKTNGKAGGTFTTGTFSKGNLTLAISGGGSVIFDGVSKGDVININGTSHTINGKTFK